MKNFVLKDSKRNYTYQCKRGGANQFDKVVGIEYYEVFMCLF